MLSLYIIIYASNLKSFEATFKKLSYQSEPFQCTHYRTCVNSFVGSERADLCERLPAGLAAVRPLPAMYAAVRGQTASIGERLVTHLTLEVRIPVVRFGFGGGVVLDDGCHLVLALIGRFVWI